MKAILSSLSIIQILAVAYGLYLINAADHAMDKSGIGNLDLWREYSSEAGASISVATFVWFLCLLLAIFKRQFGSPVGKFSVSVGPFLFIIGWSLLWLI